MIAALPRTDTTTGLTDGGGGGVQGGRISRPRLAARLSGALASGSVLITAGAGCGKTTILEQAVADAPGPVAWIGCADTERAPGTLLMRILAAIASAVPGASDALAERLAAASEQVDAIAATRELIAELPRVLVEPLVLVVDDAEHLEGAEESTRLLGELIRAEVAPLHVAVASRRPLELRVAKPRAAGRLTELTAADLAMDAEECAALLRARGVGDPLSERVREVMDATQGWPLGVALAAGVDAGPGRASEAHWSLGSLRSIPDLRSYFSEELLDSLDPRLRESAITASVPRVVTPDVAAALELGDDFSIRIERAGLLVRHPDREPRTFSYHPLLREFLQERFRDERPEQEWRRFSAAVASAIVDADPIAAVEHWLDAREWTAAVSAIERQGAVLVRTAPALIERWLSTLPDEQRGLPTMRSLEGQLAWGDGDHPRAKRALRDAVAGFRDHPNPPAEWLARFVLADSLFATGEFERARDLVQGWDDPAAAEAGVLAPATVSYVGACLAATGLFEESDRLAAAASRHPDAVLLAPIDAIRRAFHDSPRGELDEVAARLEGAVRELERLDPFNRRLHAVASLAIVLGADCGRADDALRRWVGIRKDARVGSAPFLVDTSHSWCALLHAQAGRLRDAEAELAQQGRAERGWRAYMHDLSEASVASLRGDVEQTVAAADRALDVVAAGPIVFRYWVGADLVPVLAVVGRLDRATSVLEQTMAMVDERLPGSSGALLRGRLIGLRAWLRHLEGDRAAADRDVALSWEPGGEILSHNLRREWERMEPVAWGALERDALDPRAAVDALSDAFPEGLQLIPFLDHPKPAVRSSALAPAIRSGDPRALARLEQLGKDPDREVATEAARAASRLPATLPPLRIELLGRFTLGRGSWRALESDWRRPIDARLVRLLAIHGGRAVPEDEIFEALWPRHATASARRSLQVAVSGARRVLDPPGADRSVIASGDRAYRLALGPRDTVDANELLAAAEAALGAAGDERIRLLEHARSMWRGEPLPEERYSDWAAPFRERLIDRYVAVLAALATAHMAAGEHALSAAVARELVDLDPLNEGGHRALITAYARAGRTGYALRQYLECRRALVEQLGVEPSEGTSRLQARILAGESV